MGGFLFASNPDYIGVLFENTFGLVALAAGGLLMLAGGIWLRKIVNIEV
jgi:Flp pilus assembly protein TadB